MRLSGWKAIAGLFLAAILSAPAWGANTPLPGTLNYLQGQASIGAQALSTKAIGSTELQPGESLDTGANGRAEILLTPGVFLRLGENSSVQMISPDLANTEVRLDKGRAMVEVDQIHKANDIRIAEGDATTRLLKTGLYDFEANQGLVRVFDGQALVHVADRQVKVKGGREVNVNTEGKLKAEKFRKKDYYDEGLYRFSSLRSDYLAAANAQAANVFVAYGWGPGPGWWWSPWFGGYTFVPAAGVFYSPFGWGFYSPVFFGSAFYYPYWGWRTPYAYPHSGLPHYGVGPRFGVHPMSPGFRGPGIGAFHGGPVGGFRGAMGGFRGGMGFH